MNQSEAVDESLNCLSPMSHMSPTQGEQESMKSILSKLKPVSDDFMSKLNESIRCDGSISEYSYTVNDSAAGLSFDEVYEKKEVLGEGAMAMVYRCIHRDRRYSYAVKEVLEENYDTPDQDIKEEIDALRKLRDGPYILKLWDVFTGPEETHLIMELMKGGDLLAKLVEKEVFSEIEARRISRRLIEAVHFCHKKHIVHRDIKLDNILLIDEADDTRIKLADFGCAKPFIPGEKCLQTLCGSPQYAAPELFMHEDGYDEKCDIWSIGVVIFVLLGGYAPFEGDGMELREMICDGYFEFSPVYWEDISENAKNLVKRLLVVDSEERATLVDALDSEWLRRRDKESNSKYRHMGLDGSISNTFDAWIKLQSDTNHSKMQSGTNHSSLSVDDMNNSCHSLSDE